MQGVRVLFSEIPPPSQWRGVAGARTRDYKDGRPPSPLLPMSSGRTTYLGIHKACLLQGDLWLGQ